MNGEIRGEMKSEVKGVRNVQHVQSMSKWSLSAISRKYAQAA